MSIRLFIFCVIISSLLINLCKNSIHNLRTLYVSSRKSLLIKYPKQWNWKNITEADASLYEGVFSKSLQPGNYASNVINQHRSNWCGCCYLIAVLQMIQDRVHVTLGIDNKIENEMVPVIEFDAQLALNAYDKYNRERVGGTWNACRGGDPLKVIKAIMNEAVPLVVTGSDGYSWVGYPEIGETSTKVNNNIKIDGAYQLEATNHEIQGRIMQFGSVVLGIDSACMLQSKLKNGVIDVSIHGKRNHAVSVIGWIEKNGENHWIIRNSWGMERAPKDFPDINCVLANSNNCDIKWDTWIGSTNDPGYIYVPFSYAGLKDEPSPWYDAILKQQCEIFPDFKTTEIDGVHV